MKFSACGVEDMSRFDPATGSILLKFDVNGRRIDKVQDYDLQRNPTWQHLQDWLQWFFGHLPEHLTYFDEEGDSIALGSDVEWEEALKVAKNNGNQLHLCISSSKINEDEASVLYPFSDRDTGKDCRSRTSQEIPDCLFSMPSVPTSPNLEDHDLPSSLFSVPTSPIPEDLPTSTPPLWFADFMQKFKQELGIEIIMKMNREFQKRCLTENVEHTMTETKQTHQETEELLSSTSTTKTKYCCQNSAGSSVTLYDESVCPVLPSTFLKSVMVKSSCSQTSCSGSGIDSLVYHNVICHNCHSNIIGIRYKCGNCIDFDLCAACESETDNHNPEHVFIKLRKPSKVVGAERKGRLCPLLRRVIYAKDNSERKCDGGHHGEKDHAESTLQQSLHLAASVELGEPRIVHCARKQSDARMVPTFNQLRPVRATMDAEFLYDETIPDGTRLLPGVKFTKIWRIFNSGSHPWNCDTMLKFLWGTKGFAPDLLEVTVPDLQPGQSGSISVEYVAPNRRGHYESHWNLVHKGHLFGHRIWCSIEVVNPDSEVDHLNTSTHSVEVQEPENGEKQKLASASVVPQDKGVLSQNSTLLDHTTSQTKSSSPMNSQSLKSKETNEFVIDGLDICKAKDDLQDSELDSVVSVSSSDSESEFVVVPMPSCFDVPFVPSPVDLGNSSVVPKASIDHRKFSSSSSSVVFIKSDGEDSPKGILSNSSGSPVEESFGIGIDHNYALPCAAISGASALPSSEKLESQQSQGAHHHDVKGCKELPMPMATDLLTDAPDTIRARRLSMETGETLPVSLTTNIECSDVKNSNENFTSESPPLLMSKVASCEKNEEDGTLVSCTPEICHTETTDEVILQCTENSERTEEREVVHAAAVDKASTDDEKIVHILPESLVSAAASIFNSARTAFSSVQWVPAASNDDLDPPVHQCHIVEHCEETGAARPLGALTDEYAALSAVLWEMGFCNNALNASVIEKHCGDLEKVVDELLLHYDNDWHAHRH